MVIDWFTRAGTILDPGRASEALSYGFARVAEQAYVAAAMDRDHQLLLSPELNFTRRKTGSLCSTPPHGSDAVPVRPCRRPVMARLIVRRAAYSGSGRLTVSIIVFGCCGSSGDIALCGCRSGRRGRGDRAGCAIGAWTNRCGAICRLGGGVLRAISAARCWCSAASRR